MNKQHKEDKTEPMSLVFNETFLIKDSSRMHKDALVDNQEEPKKWELFLRQHVFTDQKFGLTTQMMFSYPHKKKTSVVLCQAFPVLNGAKIIAEEKDFVISNKKAMRSSAMGNVELFFSTILKTHSHGHVNLLGISVLPSSELRDSCKLEISTILTNTKGGESIRLEETGLTLSMTNLGKKLDEVFLFMVTMVIPFTGCRKCMRSSNDTTTTHPQMLKCGRCWDKLRFPVWYCCAECQHADYARHRAQEGCGCINK